jgi:hypothetical protein
VDGQTATAAKDFSEWIDAMLQSVHRQGYRVPGSETVGTPKGRFSRLPGFGI